MFLVTFNGVELILKDLEADRVLFNQPFKPDDGSGSRPWNSKEEALEYWNSQARKQFSHISDEEITVE